jgi:hypothetical protein
MVELPTTSVDDLQKVRRAYENKIRIIPNKSTRSISVSVGQSLPSTAGAASAMLGIPSPRSRKR